MTLLACPVPLDLRHRPQWQCHNDLNSPEISYLTEPQMQLPENVSVVNDLASRCKGYLE